MGRLPDFIIIGAQRSGTTSLYATLGQHSEIGLSNRGMLDEIHYFANAKRFNRGPDWYMRQFESDAKIIGEKSPMYLQHHLAPRRIKRAFMNPPKFIIMLRNPIDRAYSNYRKALAKGFVDGTFEEALEIEESLPEPQHNDWVKFWGGDYHLFGFLARGYYAAQLRRWLEFFDSKQFLIVRSEDFYANSDDVLRHVLEFVGASFEELQISHLQKLSYPKMSARTRWCLREHFEPKNRELYDLIGRDMRWE